MNRTPEESESRTGLWNSWSSFWFEPIEIGYLHATRFLTGLLLLGWLLSFAFSYQDAVGREGWLDSTAYDVLTRLPAEANVALSWGRSLVPTSPAMMGVLYLVALVNAALLALGIATFITAPVGWLSVVIFTSNPVLYDGAHSLLLVLLLYLSVGYVVLDVGSILAGQPGFLKARLGRDSTPSVCGRLTLRLIQVHFAIIVLASVLHKFQDAEWWAGDALWYSIYTPFETNVSDLLRQSGKRDGWLTLLSLMTYATLAWQLTYPIQPCSPLGRRILMAGALVGWIWCAFVAKEPIFGPALLIGSLAALWASSSNRTISVR